MTTRPASTQLCSAPALGGRRVGIVGAGIGGLTAALLLLRAGFDVRVFEQAPALREAGAGVQLSPNASRILHRLGLADDLAGAGVKPAGWHQRRWYDGSTLLRAPLADLVEDAFAYPYYVIHRADLLYALAASVPVGRIHLGHRLTGVCDRGDCVEARFANGASAEVDVLVGADGIQSAVRRQLFGEESAPYSGCVAYRGLVPAKRVRHLGLDTAVQMWMGAASAFRALLCPGR